MALFSSRLKMNINEKRLKETKIVFCFRLRGEKGEEGQSITCTKIFFYIADSRQCISQKDISKLF